jgi:hypothetical protein
MEDLRVPTVALEAEIRYFDERTLAGKVFLPSRAQKHDGPMRADEWMNQTSGFFPFVPDGEKRARILNKRYVVILTVTGWHDEVEALEEIGVARRVRVECGGIAVEGIVHVNLPETQSRLLDWMNGPDAFLLVRDGERWHIIQKNRITTLTELGD